MSFPYKHVLLIGATSGIGSAMASCMIHNNIKVTAVGRRQDRLDQFVASHNSNATAIQFDVSKLSSIPAFVEAAFQKHPDIDCVFLNAGIQARYNFAKPEGCDLEKFLNEVSTNFNASVALTHAVLPYLLKSPKRTGLIYTGSGIGIIPASPLPAYSASKAALDAFVLCLRDQLKNTKTGVVNLWPPPVQTELHDVEHPETGAKMGMPLDEYTNATWKELEASNDDIVIGTIGGSSREQLDEVMKHRNEAFARLCPLLASWH